MVPVQLSRVIINVETLSSAEMAQTSLVWYRTLNLNCCTCFAQNFNKVNMKSLKDKQTNKQTNKLKKPIQIPPPHKKNKQKPIHLFVENYIDIYST